MLPFELTKDTPYLALSGELWSVFYEYFNRNWSCYKGFLLYVITDPWDVITDPFPNFNTSLAEPLLKFEHGSVITCHTLVWM